MAQSGFTPISLYFSATSAAVPLAADLVAGELALNTNDGKLYFKNNSGVVTLLAGSSSGPAGGSTTQVQYNNAGVLAGITGATTNGTALTLVAPVLGTPASGVVTNLTGTASININGTVGATTANTGAFTSGTFSTTLGVTGATTLSSALTYGGVTLSNAVTGTGNMVLSASPTLTGTTTAATINATALNGTLGATTPAAASVTTLAASGLVTGNAGAVFNWAGGTGVTFNRTDGAGFVYLNKSNGVNGVFLSSGSNGELAVYTGAANALAATFTSTQLTLPAALSAGATSVTTLAASGAVSFTGTNQSTTIGTQGTGTEASIVYLVGGTGASGGGGIAFDKNSSQKAFVGMSSRNFGGTSSDLVLYSAADTIIGRIGATAVTTTSSTGLSITGTLGTGTTIITGAAAGYALRVTGNASAGYGALIENQNTTATSVVIDVWHYGTTGDNAFTNFFTEGSPTLRGSITYNRAGGLTAYNTTSDYRSKDITGKYESSGETIDQLQVYMGKMKDATISRPMMIAHEAASVVPYAVTGEKDAEDDKGEPIYQSMDHQIFVPLLIAEVQALRSRVALLEAK